MPNTKSKSTKKPSTVSRKTLVAVITENVEWLVQRGRLAELRRVMESTGYISNHRGTTCREYGAAIIALAGVIDRDWLGALAESAAFHRVYDSFPIWSVAQRAGDHARLGQPVNEALA